MVPAPRGVAIATINSTWRRGKRKEEEVDEKTRPQKVRRVEGNFLSMREDGVDRPDMILVSKVREEADSSPYNVIQGALADKRFVLGDPTNSANAFQWASISENLPFSTTYNASEPKLRE